MLTDDRLDMLARVARAPHGTLEGGSSDPSILLIAAASYGSRPNDETTVPTGFDPQAAMLFESIVEGAYLVATADGVFDEDEKRVFERVVMAACGGSVPQKLVSDLVADLADLLEEDGLEQRVTRLGDALKRREHASEVLRIAALIAQVSDDVSSNERSMLERLATAFKLDKGEVDQALDDVKKSLRAD